MCATNPEGWDHFNTSHGVQVVLVALDPEVA